MTKEEAIKHFEDLREYKVVLSDLSVNEQQELFDMAISALRESNDIDKILNKAELIKTYTDLGLKKDQVAMIVDRADECFKSDNKGTWKEIEFGLECSQCGVKIMTFRFMAENYKICPKCFADMRGDKAE